MEHLTELTDLLQEGTVRGVLVTLFSTVLLIMGKKTWTWLRTPTPLSPMVKSIVEYLLDNERLEDSKVQSSGALLYTPKMGVHPSIKQLDLVGVGDVWDTLTSHEQKVIHKTQKKCVKAIQQYKSQVEADETERELTRVRKEAEKVLVPFVEKREWKA